MKPDAARVDAWDGKPYHSFGSYLRRRYDHRVWKVTLDAGMTCPNRDGRLGTGGCAYCNREGHGIEVQAPLPLREQIALGMERLRDKRNADRFIAYFQAGTNTYAPLDSLRATFDVIREFDGIVALAVGTRPDCLGEPVLDLLESYAADYEVWLEIGMQTAHDSTLERINRGHNLDSFLDAWKRALGRPLKCALHLIFGLPGEGRAEMLETVKLVAGLQADGIKIHPLQVLRGTPMEKLYRDGEIKLLEREEYVSIVCDALEMLPPETVVQRLTAEAPPDILVAPEWCRDKKDLLNAIDDEMARRGTRQGQAE